MSEISATPRELFSVPAEFLANVPPNGVSPGGKRFLVRMPVDEGSLPLEVILKLDGVAKQERQVTLLPKLPKGEEKFSSGEILNFRHPIEPIESTRVTRKFIPADTHAKDIHSPRRFRASLATCGVSGRVTCDVWRAPSGRFPR